MKVLLVGSRGIPARYGGVERHVEELAPRLAARGIEVVVGAMRRHTPAVGRWRGVEILRLPALPQKHLEMISGTALALLVGFFKGIDLVHFESADPAILSIFLPRSLPVVATSHGRAYRGDKWGTGAKALSRLAERIFLRRPDVCIAVSRGLQEYYRAQGAAHVRYIPNGISVDRDPRTESLARFGLDREGYYLFVGRIIPSKGIETLLEAHRLLPSPRLPLVIVGGESHSRPYAETLQSVAAPGVRFLGPLYGEALAQLYTHAAALVQPSEAETMPMVLLEGVSMGCPTVFSDLPEHREVAREFGLPFRARDAADLARALGRVMEERGRWKEAALRGREAFRREYDWERIADAHVALYRELGD